MMVLLRPCQKKRMLFLPSSSSSFLLLQLVVVIVILSSQVVQGQQQQQQQQQQKNYTYDGLDLCDLSTSDLAKLGPDEYIEPCIIFDEGPKSTNTQQQQQQQQYPNNKNNSSSSSSATITMVHVTPSGCGNHRDGTVTGIRTLNGDNDGKGIALGYNEDYYVTFRLVSVVAGNPATLSEDEYDRRHVQILNSMITTLDAPYIVGSCSFAAAIEKGPARQHKSIVMSQVGPPGFYKDDVVNDYVFGFHINSDDYPLPAVQSLGFVAAETSKGPEGIPVRVIYRTKSEFFFSTCRSAINKLISNGFTDLKEILYDHAADHDDDGEINQFDEDFLISVADEVCPPKSNTDDEDDFHPALFVCTLTEQDMLIKRWMENGCRPTSIWLTASTWGWANNNPNAIPYYQGGGQWHEAMDYSDDYFESGQSLLKYNENQFGYMGNYDQVVAYAIPVLYAQHLLASYRVEDNPDPIGDFHDDDKREMLRRAMIVLNVPTIFGQVAFNNDQRNIGRSAAGSQWLPEKAVVATFTTLDDENNGDNNNMDDDIDDDDGPAGTTADISEWVPPTEEPDDKPDDITFRNSLVSPFLQAEADTVIPSPGAQPCEAGSFLNETLRNEAGSLLAASCTQCPVNTYTKSPSQQTQCTPCPEGSSTEGQVGSDVCIVRDDNLIPPGILAFGYVASALSYMFAIGFITWLIYYRSDPVVRVSQMEFLLLICIGTIISTSTVVALSFQAGSGEDTTAASNGCAAAPFLYAIGWVLQYSSLSAKTYRLFRIMRCNHKMKRVVVSAWRMAIIVVGAVAVDLVILICWLTISPLEYVRSDGSTSIDEENGIITISTVGQCRSSNLDVGFWAFAGPILAFHLLIVIVTNVLLYNVREVGDRYQEQKYVAMASALMCEIFVVGIPVLVAVSDSPTAMFIVLTGIIALDDIGILCCIFFPKVIFQRKGLQEGVAVGESIMRESHKRASTREYARRESSFRPSFNASELPLKSSSDDSPSREFVRIKVSNDSNSSNGKSKPVKMYSSVDNSSIVSQSIVEETEEDLKDESSDRAMNSGLVGLRVDNAATDVTAAKSSFRPIQQTNGSIETPQSSLRIGGVGTNPVIPGSQISDLERNGLNSSDVDSLDHSERMLSATKKLMEEHAMMMKATAEIMRQHEILKQQMIEADSWNKKAIAAKTNAQADEASLESKPQPPLNPMEMTPKEMKERLLSSNNWSTGSEKYISVPSNSNGTGVENAPSETNEQQQQQQPTQNPAVVMTGAQTLWLANSEVESAEKHYSDSPPDDENVQMIDEEQGRKQLKQSKSEITVDTEENESDSSDGVKSDLPV